MPLSLEHRRVGDITVVTCAGRIVEGAELIAAQKLLDDLLQYDSRLVLHLGAVDFLDSSGLGLLVRYVTRARNAHGHLKLCALSPKIVQVLDVTHLRAIFDAYDSEADAISAFYQRAVVGGGTTRLDTDILCVDRSSDVQAYLRGLLAQAGYGVLTAGNLVDGLVLLQATAPKVVIIGTDLRMMRETRSAEKFNSLADARSVIVLPEDFSRRDAEDAGQPVLDQVRALLPASGAV
jgi:anti-sigma B factor antagonist